MSDFAQVTITGAVVEQPSKNETENGIPTAHFWLQVTRRWTGRAGQECDSTEYVEIHATGHPANSIAKYWYPGVEVVIVGTLKVRNVPDAFTQAARQMDPTCTFARSEMYAEAQTIGYMSPRAVAEAAKARGRTW